MTNSKWQRVTKRRPCPACGRPDWCLFAGDPTQPAAALCARTESKNRVGESGWLHVLRNDGPTWQPWQRTIRAAAKLLEPTAKKIDFAAMAQEARTAVRPAALESLGNSLAVTTASLKRLGIGWLASHRAWCFPMTDADSNVRGLRLRLHGGRKLSVKGGKEGLFVASGIVEADGPLLICEGPTDAATLLDCGFRAVGRPSCTGGMRDVQDLVRRLRVQAVVIVTDNDEPGRRGAETMAAALVAWVRSVKIVAPPAGIKDARDWARSGATAADVQRVIDAAAPIVLKIRTHILERKGRTWKATAQN